MSVKHKTIAEDTLKILNQGHYYDRNHEKVDIAGLLNLAETRTELFSPEELEKLSLDGAPGPYPTEYEVTNETTLDAARRLSDENKDILCLNFASAKNPGGGFLGGAVAQEESLARASGLYPCLLKGSGYYAFHRKQGTCFYSDHMIYSPSVPVFKDEEGLLMDNLLTISFITSPAVNAGVIRKNEPLKADMIESEMRKRMEKLLKLTIVKNHSVLVLGAWGCGVFQNDPEMIAGLFHELLGGKFASRFSRIVFAVKTSKETMIDPFRKKFL